MSMSIYPFVCCAAILSVFVVAFYGVFGNGFGLAMGAEHVDPDVQQAIKTKTAFFIAASGLQVILLLRILAQSVVYEFFQKERPPAIGIFWRGSAVCFLAFNIALLSGLIRGYGEPNALVILLVGFFLFSLAANTPLKLISVRSEA